MSDSDVTLSQVDEAIKQSQQKMSKRKYKPCDICSEPVDIRYRIQYQESAEWVLVCQKCWWKVRPNNPHYRYGGTWKAKRRRS